MQFEGKQGNIKLFLGKSTMSRQKGQEGKTIRLLFRALPNIQSAQYSQVSETSKGNSATKGQKLTWKNPLL